jgi:sugar lactone lactonase YvrE
VEPGTAGGRPDGGRERQWRGCRMRRSVAALVVTVVLVGLVGCGKKPARRPAEKAPDTIKPTLFLSLDETCNVPDGMALDEDSNIMLSVPNYVDPSHAGRLMKLTIVDGKPTPSVFYMLPPHPETGKVPPMGLEFGPDGNVYVADNQYFLDKNYKSRLLKVIVKDGEAVGCEVAVDGFKLANAVRWKGNDVYVSDTFFDLKHKKHQSGVYRISLAEMNAGTVTLLPDAKDPHLVAQYTAKDFGKDEETAGADGVCFDSEGNLYCGNFGDGVISRTTFNADGSVRSQEVIVDDPEIECCDGITCDLRTDEVYITNSKNNSIHVLDTKTSEHRLLWVNDDDNGATGLLDQPCEPLLRGDELIVVNFDYTFPGLKNSENDEHNTLSVFKLK